MRIVTWNMDYRGHAKVHDEAWNYLLKRLRPDIALLQECVPPSAADGTLVMFEQAYPQARQRWGTAIVVRGLGAQRSRLDDVAGWLAKLGPEAQSLSSATRLESWCVSAEIELPNIGRTLVSSMHNPFFPIKRQLLEGTDVSDIKLTLSRDVWLLDVVVYFLRARLPRPMLLGGDFNYSRLLDAQKPRGNREFFERLTANGFSELHRQFHDDDQQTYFGSKQAAHQLDYFISDQRLADRAMRCDVNPRAESENLSDHSPLVLELDVTQRA